mmetsp:Transcript_14431/g.30493  ORF Transcript_14431/g.30493 Transcript_14431/m.30493 type:complete len:391 (-) Transcript_14431:286-1458(-)
MPNSWVKHRAAAVSALSARFPLLCAAFVVGVAAALVAWPQRLGWATEYRVPVINLRADDSSQLEAWRAATVIGAARVRGHRLHPQNALNASRQLFTLPLNDKLALASSGSSPGFHRGYIPLGGESGLRENLELKEGFCYGYEWPATQPLPNALVGPNVWPSSNGNGDEWISALREHFNGCGALVAEISHRLVQVLQLPFESALLHADGEPISIMRLFHYYPRDHLPELARSKPRTGSSAHTDWHSLTLITQDDTGGLQLLAPDGSWLDVPANKDDIVLLFGDFLQIASQGKCHAPLHRVLLPASAGVHRYSLTYFAYPSYDTTLPADAVVSAATLEAEAERKQRAARVGSFNSLIAGFAREDLLKLATTRIGDLLLRKWSGVEDNRLRRE